MGDSPVAEAAPGPPAKPVPAATLAPRLRQLLVKYKRWLTALLLVGILVAGVLVAKKYLPFKHYLTITRGWIERHYTIGAFALSLMLIIAVPLAVPCSLIEILAGSLFGVARGIMLSVVGKIGRKRIGNYLQHKYPFFRAMFGVLQGGDWKPLVIVQLSGIPNVIKCYGLSITNVSIWRFLLTTLVGALPYSAMWCWIGFETSDFLVEDQPEHSVGVPTRSHERTNRLIIMIVGGVLTVVALAVMAWYTRRQLKHLQDQAKTSPEESSQCSTSDVSESNGGSSRVLPVSHPAASAAQIVPVAMTAATIVELTDKSEPLEVCDMPS